MASVLVKKVMECAKASRTQQQLLLNNNNVATVLV